MKQNVKSLMVYSVGAVMLTACATNSRDQQAALRASLEKKDFNKAREIVSKADFLSEKNNALLKLMERGRTFFLAQDYYQALQEFDKARDLSVELFTVSMSKKAASVLVNDNSDNYYGESYEKSMIRYYQSLTHHMLSRAGVYEAHTIFEKGEKEELVPRVIAAKTLSLKERQFHSTASKSILLDWDSYLSSLKATTGGVVTFKDDLMAKLYGAYIHQSAGSKTDTQIAKDLYKSAKTVLQRNYNIYNSFNEKSAEFRSNFSKLAEMPIAEVEKNFIEQTKNYKDLEGFINNQITSIEKGKANNVLFVIENGMIQPKVVKKIEFPLISGESSRKVASLGNGFVDFSQNILSLAKDSIPKIYFELPEVPFRPVSNSSTLLVESLDGKIKSELPLFVVGPMDEIANQALDERSTSLYAKTGIRVAGKHLAALTAAYAVYQQAKGNGEMLAMAAATMSYSAANKLIEQSERADLRSWNTLPQNFSLTSGRFPAGEYKVSVRDGESVFVMPNVVIDKSARNIVNLQK